MGWNSAAYPAGWVSVTSAKHCNLFGDADTLAFTLSASTAVTYEVRNYYGTVVRSGSVSGTSLTLAALPLGWYCLYLYQAGSDATYGSLIGKSMFSVLRTDVRLASPPAAGTTPSQNIAFAGADHIVRGVSLFGPHRNQINDASDPNGTVPFGSVQANIVATQADRGYQRTWYDANADSARPRPAFLQFPNGGYQTAAHTTGVTQVVTALYPDIGYFEGPTNEPQGTAAATVAGWMQTFYNAVKAGNASAKVLGPCPVAFNGGTGGLQWLAPFLAAGGGQYMDALSVHAYNCIMGDITAGRKSLNYLKVLLAQYGLSNVELWQTEWGQFAATYGVFDPRRQAQWWAIHRFVLDQYAIPKERDCWFYDTSHGFWDFPSMWKFGDDSVMPMIAMARVYSQEVFGKTWAAALDFGTVENDFYIGSRFTGVDGSATLAMVSDGRTDGTVSLSVTGATSLQIVDCFGTVTTTSRTAGIVAVPVGKEPSYVRVPAGVTATVEQVSYGVNVTRLGTRNVTQGTTDAQSVTDGVLTTGYYGTLAEATPFLDDAALPATVTVKLRRSDAVARISPIDCIIVHCPTPWQAQASLLDFDVEYQDSVGVWHTVQTITEATNTFSSPTNQSQMGCFYDSYYSNRSVFVTRFAAVVAQAVRLTVRSVTAGGEATAAAQAVGGQGNGTLRIVLDEVAVYSRDLAVRVPAVIVH